MTTIGSLSNITSTALTDSSAVTSLQEAETVDSTDIESTSESDQFSKRATNIQKLNEEFFADGLFTINEDFVSRLEEYGLISTGEKDQLMESSYFDDGSDSESTQVDGLSSQIDSLIDRLSELDAESPLLEALSNAKTILDNLDSFALPSADVEQVIANLETQVAQSDLELTEQEYNSLTELDLALQVAQMLGVQKTSSDAVNSYLEIYNQD